MPWQPVASRKGYSHNPTLLVQLMKGLNAPPALTAALYLAFSCDVCPLAAEEIASWARMDALAQRIGGDARAHVCADLTESTVKPPESP